MTEFAGKTVLITGASRGIGAAAARAFAAAGANVALTARSEEALAELAGEIGPRAIAVPCDVSRYDEVEAAVAATCQAFGGLDILINNAGAIEPIARLEASSPDDWGKVIDVNLKGVYHGIRAALPVMKSAGGGTVINISSGAAYNPIEAWSHYCSAKAGVLMLTKMLHHEEGANGIRAMGLSPGTVATQMQREIKASGINPVSRLEWEDHIPPEWPAKALMWMCTPDSDAYLGQDVMLRDETIRKTIGVGE